MVRLTPRAVALLALLVLAPLAAADHVFSHRLYVVGRVVDADGLPASAVPVSVAFEGVEVGGRCALEGRADATDATGDFRLCRHAHAVPEGGVAIVRAGDAEATVPVDALLREARALLTLSGPRAARDVLGDREFNATILVHGRVMEKLSAPTEVEGVAVTSAPFAGENVTVSLSDGGKRLVVVEATTDEMGFYAARLRLDRVPEDARAVVQSRDLVLEEPVSLAHRRADVGVVHGLDVGGPFPGERAPAPGAGPGALLALAAALALVRKR